MMQSNFTNEIIIGRSLLQKGEKKYNLNYFNHSILHWMIISNQQKVMYEKSLKK